MTSTPKIALINGGSRGLGRNTAVSLAGRGVDVILTHRTREDQARVVVAQIEALGRKAVALHLDAGDVASFEGSAGQVRGAVRDDPAGDRLVAQATALGRACVPDYIGPMIAALLSDDDRWIDGQPIEVAGGAFL